MGCTLCRSCFESRRDDLELLTSFNDYLMPSDALRDESFSFRGSASFSSSSPNKLLLASLASASNSNKNGNYNMVQTSDNSNLTHNYDDNVMSSPSPYNRPASFSSPRDKRKVLNWTSDVPLNKWKFIKLDNSNRVKSLQLSDMGFNGIFPSFNLRYLTEIDMSCNSFVGEMPWSVISEMTTIEVFDISQNQLTGDIPWLRIQNNLTNLNVFNVSENNFVGSITENMWESWPKSLRFLDIHGNRFYGEMDKNGIDFMNYMRRSPKRYVDIRDNKGFVLDFSHITSYSIDRDLSELRLQNSSLLDCIPHELSFLYKLIYVNLSWNGLIGPLPDISHLKMLKFLDISHNNLAGPLPSAISRLRQLQCFSVGSNLFSGSLPVDYFSNCFALEKLNISYNRLVISKPFRVFHLPHLDIADVFCVGNAFEDSQTEADCTALPSLRTRKNRADYRWNRVRPFVLVRHYILSAIYHMNGVGVDEVIGARQDDLMRIQSYVVEPLWSILRDKGVGLDTTQSFSESKNTSGSNASTSTANNKRIDVLNPSNLDQIYDDIDRMRVSSLLRDSFYLSTVTPSSDVYTPLLADDSSIDEEEIFNSTSDSMIRVTNNDANKAGSGVSTAFEIARSPAIEPSVLIHKFGLIKRIFESIKICNKICEFV